MVIVFLLAPCVFGAIVGALVFVGLKVLVDRPGDWLRMLSGLVASGIAAGLVLLGAKVILGTPQTMGDGNVVVAASLRTLGAPLAGIFAFALGLGIGQKPKSDWIG